MVTVQIYLDQDELDSLSARRVVKKNGARESLVEAAKRLILSKSA